VTADDVKHGKPDPEPYRKGAEQLKVNPAECVAVEDAPRESAPPTALGCE